MLNLKIAWWCTPLRGESFASERPRSVYAYANRARVFMRCPFMLPFLPPGHFLFIHAAFRFAPSKNRLRNASLSNRDRTADVSLGFLHSNWITQAAAHRQQGCTPWLLEGHSKNSIKKKKMVQTWYATHRRMCTQANGQRNMHGFKDAVRVQCTLLKHSSDGCT